MGVPVKESMIDLASVLDCVARIADHAGKMEGCIAESRWADVFHDRIAQSSWLKDKSFTPGRWAVGYQYLSVLYRILDEMHPKCILDLGLGQTTRMIAQYAEANPDVKHIVVESSTEWIEFFKNSCFALPPNTKIVHCPYGVETFNGVEGVRTYQNFLASLDGYKFDFISIDAPLSGDMKVFGRIDTVKLLPLNLDKRHVILFDDTDRSADNASFGVIAEALVKMDRTVRIGCFHGMKWCCAAVSKDLAFLLDDAQLMFSPRGSDWQKKLKSILRFDKGIVAVVKGVVAEEVKQHAECLIELERARQDRKAAVEKIRQERDAVRVKLEDVRRSVLKIRCSRDCAEQKLIAMRAARDEALNKVTEMRKVRDEALQKVAEMRDARNASEQRVTEMRAARNEALSKVTEMRKVRDEALQKVAEMRDARNASEQLVTEMRAARNEALSKVTEMRKVRDEARAKMVEMRSVRDEVMEQIAQMRTSRDDARKQLVEMREKRDELRNSLAVMRVRVKNLESVIRIVTSASNGGGELYTT